MGEGPPTAQDQRSKMLPELWPHFDLFPNLKVSAGALYKAVSHPPHRKSALLGLTEAGGQHCTTCQMLITKRPASLRA